MANTQDYFLIRQRELTTQLAQLKQEQRDLQTSYGASASDAIAELQEKIAPIEAKLKAADAALSGHDPDGALEAQVEQGLAFIQEQKAIETDNPSELNGPILDLADKAIPLLSGALSGALDHGAAKQALQSILDQIAAFKTSIMLEIGTVSRSINPNKEQIIADLQRQLLEYAADTMKIRLLMQTLTTPSSSPAESSRTAATPSTSSSSSHYASALPRTALYTASTHTETSLAGLAPQEGQRSTQDVPSAAPAPKPF